MQEVGLEWVLYKTPIRLKEITAPAAAEVPSNTVSLYAKDSSGESRLFYKSDAGTEYGPLSSVGGSGTANRLAYWSATNTLAANAALTSGRVPYADSNGLLTDNTHLQWDATDKGLKVTTITANLRGFICVNTNTSAQGPLFVGRKTNGTVGSETATASGDVMLDLNGQGHDGTNFTGGRALLRFAAAQAFTSSNQGTTITIHTTPLNSTTIAERMRIDSQGNVIINTAAISTSATDGFLYIPTCAGTPTGTPTAYTGRDAMVYDTTNNKLYVYNGAWKGVTLA